MMFTKEETNKIKGIAILLLIFHHMYRTVEDIGSRGVRLYTISPENLSKIAFCFRICVFIFSFLSAYGIAVKYASERPHNSTIRFILKRWIKLLAPYVFTLVCLWGVFLIIPSRNLDCYEKNPLYMVMDLLAINDVTGHGGAMLDGVFWYMSYAVVQLLLFPLFYALVEKFDWYALLAFSVIYNFIPSVFVSDNGGDYNKYFFTVILGILFARNSIFDKLNKSFGDLRTVWKICVGTLLLMLSFIAPYMAWFVVETNIFGVQAIFHTIGALACICFCFLIIRNKIATKLLNELGAISGDIFLIHVIVFITLWKVVFYSKFLIAQYLCCVCLCIIFAIILKLLKQYSGYNSFIAKIVNKI